MEIKWLNAWNFFYTAPCKVFPFQESRTKEINYSRKRKHFLRTCKWKKHLYHFVSHSEVFQRFIVQGEHMFVKLNFLFLVAI